MSHRWPEIARLYAEVNQLFGDIVKVTPSSKVVGDMALFLFSRGIRPEDVVNLEPGVTPFPESVIDMFNGGLGWPPGRLAGTGLAGRAGRGEIQEGPDPLPEDTRRSKCHRALPAPVRPREACAPSFPRSSSAARPMTTCIPI